MPNNPHKKTHRFWPQTWWRLMEYRIGIIPLPVYIVLFALIIGFVVTDTMTQEICIQIALLAVGGFTCAEIGKRAPLLRNIGGAAICATFIPSFLVFYHLLPADIINNVTDFTKMSNFLYLFITCIIVGSILSMDRHVLIAGFLKIFIPLAVGSIAACAVGSLVGTLLELGTWYTFYFIVIPIMAGGIGEGAIPLSLGYAAILQKSQSELFVQVLPSVMLGSLTAILLSGGLNYLGKKYPHLTGEGRLQPDEHDAMDPTQEVITKQMDVSHIAAAGITAISLYLAGLLGYKLFHFPAPITMLFIAVLMKLTHAVSPKLQEGSFIVYKFFSIAVTYPLLFAIGVALTPLDKLLTGFTLPNLITIISTVFTMIITGFYVGRWLKMYPIETAIINACHSGQGGTGDVAILTAANRMTLMPFAQIATRIGGAITVLIALLAMKKFA
jgi:CCS family citrate carrier protein